MKNEYEIRGDVTAIIINSKKHGRMEALISTGKLECVKEFFGSWCAVWDEKSKTYYVQGHAHSVNGKETIVRLHRWVTNAPVGREVDHFNHNGLDNTDGNLRVATSSENKQNQKGAQRNSKSGMRGVYWNRGHEKWAVHIYLKGKKKHIGYFIDKKEAEQAAIEARKKYMPYSQEASA